MKATRDPKSWINLRRCYDEVRKKHISIDRISVDRSAGITLSTAGPDSLRPCSSFLDQVNFFDSNTIYLSTQFTGTSLDSRRFCSVALIRVHNSRDKLCLKRLG